MNGGVSNAEPPTQLGSETKCSGSSEMHFAGAGDPSRENGLSVVDRHNQ